jgi:hypothetical protein
LDPGKDADLNPEKATESRSSKVMTLRLLVENSDGGVVRSDADVRLPGDGAGGAGQGY